MKKLLTILLMLAAMNASGQWQADVRLTNIPANSHSSDWTKRNVAAYGNFVHVIWNDSRDGNNEIYYKRSTDAGANWGIDTRLTNNPANSDGCSIAVNGSLVHIVWMDTRDGNYEIYYKRSTDAGINWGADTRLTNNPYTSDNPSVSLSGSVVHVVWFDFRDTSTEIYYKRSTDSGVTWGSDIRLTHNIYSSAAPTIAVYGSYVHVAWIDSRDGNLELYYKRSTDGGISWESDVRLTNYAAGPFSPTIAVYGSIVHIMWSFDITGTFQIFYKRSTNSGVTWGTNTQLSNTTIDAESPSVTVSGPAVHVVWWDSRDGNNEIYYKRSTNSGEIWEPDIRLTNNSANSQYPSVSVSGPFVHVVWWDDRDGNNEIYYKRNPTGNPIGIINISAEIPFSYSLGQNYPNPFNPSTVVRCQLPVVSNVSLIVYDIQGREVQTLVNEKLSAGTYEVRFDGSMLTSGVYFYRMVTEGFTETKRMLMLK